MIDIVLCSFKVSAEFHSMPGTVLDAEDTNRNNLDPCPNDLHRLSSPVKVEE
jgi:hypothetical protein